MLRHQLPSLPLFEDHWNQLPNVFDWLYKKKEKEIYKVIPDKKDEPSDPTWSPPPMVHAWHVGVSIEVIRFAAANRLCVDLEYNNEHRLIEPYSLRRNQYGNILLYAVRHEDGQPRTYRIDRIQGATATNVSFNPGYLIELTTSRPLHTPETERTATQRVKSFGGAQRRSGGGPTYVVECSHCGRKFKRQTRDTLLKPHKDKNGYNCSGRRGNIIDTIY